jgi:hypothetical protein
MAMLFLLFCDTREIYKYQGNKKKKEEELMRALKKWLFIKRGCFQS